MKNILMQDFSIQENCNIILRGSYPQIAKQVAEQLLIVLESRQASAQSAEIATLRAQLTEANGIIQRLCLSIAYNKTSSKALIESQTAANEYLDGVKSA